MTYSKTCVIGTRKRNNAWNERKVELKGVERVQEVRGWMAQKAKKRKKEDAEIIL